MRRLCTLPLLLAALGGGCALVQPVQPWEKGVLAKPEMTCSPQR